MAKPKTKKFDPLQMPANQGAFDAEVNKEARAQYQPQLNEVGRMTSVEQRRHTGRAHEIGTDYNAYTKELQGSFDETRSALNDLIATHHASDEVGQQTMAAALAGAHTSDAARNATITGGNPSGAEPNPALDQDAILSAAIGSSGDTALTNRFGNIISKTGRDVALGPLGRIRANEVEQNRFSGALNDLADRRGNITANIPNIIATTRRGALSDYRSAQNQGFTQNLATKQFNLQKQGQKFTQNLQSKQFNLAASDQAFNHWLGTQNLNLNKGKLAQGWAAIKLQAQGTGKGGKGGGAGKKRAQRFVNGGKFLDSYVTPPKGFYTGAAPQTVIGKDPNTGRNIFGPDPTQRAYHPSPGSAFNTLKKRYGLSSADALRLMDSAPLKSFRDFVWVKRHYNPNAPNRHPTRPG
jgi:hypothetical protein